MGLDHMHRTERGIFRLSSLIDALLPVSEDSPFDYYRGLLGCLGGLLPPSSRLPSLWPFAQRPRVIALGGGTSCIILRKRTCFALLHFPTLMLSMQACRYRFTGIAENDRCRRVIELPHIYAVDSVLAQKCAKKFWVVLILCNVHVRIHRIDKAYEKGIDESVSGLEGETRPVGSHEFLQSCRRFPISAFLYSTLRPA